VPIGNPLGFTSTLNVAGKLTEPGVSVTHPVPPGAIAVEKATRLFPALTLTVWAAGSTAPSCQTKDKEAGVGVSTAV